MSLSEPWSNFFHLLIALKVAQGIVVTRVKSNSQLVSLTATLLILTQKEIVKQSFLLYGSGPRRLYGN
jgi:hypothetical protein